MSFKNKNNYENIENFSKGGWDPHVIASLNRYAQSQNMDPLYGYNNERKKCERLPKVGHPGDREFTSLADCESGTCQSYHGLNKSCCPPESTQSGNHCIINNSKIFKNEYDNELREQLYFSEASGFKVVDKKFKYDQSQNECIHDPQGDYNNIDQCNLQNRRFKYDPNQNKCIAANNGPYNLENCERIYNLTPTTSTTKPTKPEKPTTTPTKPEKPTTTTPTKPEKPTTTTTTKAPPTAPTEKNIISFLGIPDTVTTITNKMVEDKVKEIGIQRTDIVEIILPDTIEIIGFVAFRYCYKLKSINIPNTVVLIDKGAFGSCLSLESINIPSEIITIHNYAFTNCRKLKSINFPDGLEYIGICFISKALAKLNRSTYRTVLRA